MRKAVHVRPGDPARRPLTIPVRLQANTPAGASLIVGDTLLQAGGIASGWVPHVTEMPWTAGVVGG